MIGSTLSGLNFDDTILLPLASGRFVVVQLSLGCYTWRHQRMLKLETASRGYNVLILAKFAVLVVTRYLYSVAVKITFSVTKYSKRLLFKM